MNIYEKIVMGAAMIGIIGIPIFVIDYSDLSWHHNQEGYWGMISMVALIGAVLFNNWSNRIETRLKSKNDAEKN